MYKEKHNFQGILVCAILLVIPMSFISIFWTILAVTLSVVFLATYNAKRSLQKATLVAVNVFLWAMIPYIYIKYYMQRGESVETDYILERRLDNLWMK